MNFVLTRLSLFLRRIIAEFVWQTRVTSRERKTVHNVYIHHSGLVFKNLRLVSASANNDKRLFMTIFLFHWQKRGITSLIKIDKTVSFLGLSIWSNYYHAWCDQATRLFWLCENAPSDLTLITRGDYQEIFNSVAAATSIKINPAFIHTKGDWKWCRAKTFIVPPLHPKMIDRNTAPFKQIRDNTEASELGRRILIMRRKRTFKDPILVETEAKAKYGLETFFLEDLNLFNQITLFKSAEVVVGIHGAGLTNLLWCNANTRVFEIFALNEMATQQKGLTMYAKLAETLNLDYQPIYGQNSNRWKDIDTEFPFAAIDKFW
jgi:hypothetical protein